MFLLFGPSKFIWGTVPFFKYIQFPIRWLGISALFIALLSAPVIIKAVKIKSCRRIIMILFVVFLLLDFRIATTAYVFSSNSLLSAHGVNTSLEHLPSGVCFDAITHEGFDSKRVTCSRGTGQVTTELWNSAERRFGIFTQQPLLLRIRTFAFPGWTAYLNGRRTPILAEKETHAIVVAVPAGNHQLRLVFEDTAVRWIGKAISLISGIVLLISLIRSGTALKKGKP